MLKTWLRKNKHGALIKTEVVAKYGKGEEKSAKELVKQILTFSRKDGQEQPGAIQIAPIVKETLKAFKDFFTIQGNCIVLTCLPKPSSYPNSPKFALCYSSKN